MQIAFFLLQAREMRTQEIDLQCKLIEMMDRMKKNWKRKKRKKEKTREEISLANI